MLPDFDRCATGAMNSGKARARRDVVGVRRVQVRQASTREL